MTTVTADHSPSKLPSSSSANDVAENSAKSSSKSSSGVPPVAPHHLLPPQEEESILRKSLKGINEDIKKMEDFITLTEEIIRRERERDRELYLREKRRRRMSEMCPEPLPVQAQSQPPTQPQPEAQPQQQEQLEQPEPTQASGKEIKEDVEKPSKRSLSFRKQIISRFSGHKSAPNEAESSKKRSTFKLKSAKSKRKVLNFNPRKCPSRLYFRNGKVGCVDADESAAVDSRSNIEKTHAIVKSITDSIDQFEPTVCEKRASITSNFSDLLSDDSSISLQNSNSFFNFECSPVESDDPLPSEDYLCVENLSDVEPMDEFCGDAFKRRESKDVLSAAATHQVDVVQFVDEANNDAATIRVPTGSAHSDHSNVTLNSDMKNQVRHLVRRFTMRTGKMRSRLELPPTPSSSSITSLARNHQVQSNGASIQSPTRLQPFEAIFKADEQRPKLENPFLCAMLCGGKGSGGNKQGVLDPQGSFYISWLCIISMTFLYNAWVIPLRSAFPFQTPENTNTWLIVDFCADIIYLLDVIFIKHRIMYLYEGFWVRDKDLTRKNYMRKLKFKLDLLSLIPLDLLYLKFGTRAVYLRAPRLLKIQSFWELFRLLDRVIASPYLVRVGRTLTYMLYMIHITACTYYAYSDYQGLGSDRWVFSGKGHPYVRCFAFATKTATSIGKNPKPDSEGELMFMTAAWLMGVFVFALLIGQIRDIIATATRTQTEYRQLVDETLECMRTLNLPADALERVKKWFKFTWEQQRTIDENLILDYLPSNLKTDIAIAVHIQTLSKVQLFANCEEALLRELVLKLRSVTFLPDDYVCRKGEIGKEMYIVKWGQVQVMGGPNNDEVLATLSESSVFGEISLLSINGIEGKRRTADVKSKGFSNLFVLSKNDLNEAIAMYPQAQAILKRRAQSVMRKNAARERNERAAKQSSSTDSVDVVIGNPSTPPSPPKLLETVIKALPEKSAAIRLLTRGSRRVKRRRTSFALDLDSGSKSTATERTTHIHSTEHLATTKADVEAKAKGPPSPDLLSAIQMALAHRNKHMNLTDTEKAMIASGSCSDSNSRSDCKLDEDDGRAECFEMETLAKLNGVIDIGDRNNPNQ